MMAGVGTGIFLLSVALNKWVTSPFFTSEDKFVDEEFFMLNQRKKDCCDNGGDVKKIFMSHKLCFPKFALAEKPVMISLVGVHCVFSGAYSGAGNVRH